MTHSPAPCIADIFSGVHAQKARGFLCALPRGFILSDLFDRTIEAAYGTSQHPDVRRLVPGGKGGLITIDAVRDAGAFLASSPGGSTMKTLLVLEADRMNVAAANALLKPLEEPGRHTRIVLATDRPGSLLPTIRSRCMALTLPWSLDAARCELRARADASETDLDDDRIDTLLEIADGNPALALSLEQNGLCDWILSLPKWFAQIGDTRTPRPLPKGIGTKTGAPVDAAARALQTFLLRAARPDSSIGIPRWPSERLQAACWRLMDLMDDIDRAGIDARTRLTTMLDTIATTPA